MTIWLGDILFCFYFLYLGGIRTALRSSLDGFVEAMVAVRVTKVTVFELEFVLRYFDFLLLAEKIEMKRFMFSYGWKIRHEVPFLDCKP